jgi:hypothetical protein
MGEAAIRPTALAVASLILILSDINMPEISGLESMSVAGPGRVKTFFLPQKLQAAGRDPRGRDRLSIFLLYRVWSQSGRNLEPC